MKSTLVGAALLVGTATQAQLTIQTNLTPEQLVRDVLVGSCVEVFNVTFNGQPGTILNEQAGKFTAGANVNLGLPTGVILGSGNVLGAVGPNNSGSYSLGGGNFNFGDPDLTTLSGVTTHDAAILEFDFIPSGDELSFRYVFGSEEYNEYVCATVNDVFGFFLSGPGISGPYSNNAINLATLPGSNVPVTINTVNNGTVGSSGSASNCSNLDPNWTANNIYYVDNAGSATIQYDGMTVVLTATSPVICGETYHIKLAIADGGDTAWDSGVFIEGGSFSSVPLLPTITYNGNAVDSGVVVESCLEYEFALVPNYCDTVQTQVVYLSYSGTATMGVDIVPPLPDSVVYTPGTELPPFTFTAPIDADGDEVLVITVVALDCQGNSVTSSIELLITSLPPLTVTGTGGSFLCGQSIELVPQATGAIPVYTYLWNTGETTPTISPTPTASTTYTVTVTDPCGISATHDFQTTLLPAPPMPVSILGSATLDEGCEHGIVLVERPNGAQGDLTLTVTTSGSATSGSDYLFGPDLVIPAGAPSAQFPFTTIADGVPEGPENAVLNVTFTNACAQTVGDQVEFTILNVDPFQLVLDDVHEECREDSLQVLALVNGGIAPLTFIWSTGDTLVNDPRSWISLEHEQTVYVTVIDDCGSTVTGSFDLTLDCTPVVPNVFTPNGDGDNEYFHISGTAGRPTHLRIYNRWGQMVYEAPNYNNSWRGTDLPEGTYFYEVLIRDEEPITGHVTILR